MLSFILHYPNEYSVNNTSSIKTDVKGFTQTSFNSHMSKRYYAGAQLGEGEGGGLPCPFSKIKKVP